MQTTAARPMTPARFLSLIGPGNHWASMLKMLKRNELAATSSSNSPNEN